MSEKLCTLRTKGGGGGATQTETVLWTNPNPTDSNGFAAQTVTLSDSISNYDYIYVTYGFNHGYTNITSKTHYLVSEFKNLTLGNNTRHFIGQGGAQDASNNTYTREIYYISDTSIGFTTGYGVNKALSAADVLIPTSIIGIKNMGGGSSRKGEGTTVSETWTGATKSITISGKYTHLDVFMNMSATATVGGVSQTLVKQGAAHSTYGLAYASFEGDYTDPTVAITGAGATYANACIICAYTKSLA